MKKETNWLTKRIEKIEKEFEKFDGELNEYPIDEQTHWRKKFLSQKLHSLVEEAVREIIKEIQNAKFQHAHYKHNPPTEKEVDEAYDCGCAWRNNVLDELIDTIDYDYLYHRKK